MDYRIVVTKDAEEDLDKFIQYLIVEKGSLQAARNVLDDFDTTIESLKYLDPKLYNELGLKYFSKYSASKMYKHFKDLVDK